MGTHEPEIQLKSQLAKQTEKRLYFIIIGLEGNWASSVCFKVGQQYLESSGKGNKVDAVISFPRLTRRGAFTFGNRDYVIFIIQYHTTSSTFLKSPVILSLIIWLFNHPDL